MLKKSLRSLTVILFCGSLLVGCGKSSQISQPSDTPNQPSATNSLPETVNNADTSFSDSIYERVKGDRSIVYSTDQGETWISKTEFEKTHPTSNIEWWTYDDYADFIEQQKIELPKLADTQAKGSTQSRGDFTWTHELVDETIKKYEQLLDDIKNGVKISKVVEGLDNSCGYANYSLDPIEPAVTSVGIVLPDGTTKQFDEDDKTSAYDKAKLYCEQQVTDGLLTQKQMDDILAMIKNYAE